MATIVFDDPDDEFTGKLRGLTFSKSQAGFSIRSKQTPINPQPTDRMKNRLIVREMYQFYANLDFGQKTLWAVFATQSGIPGPVGIGGPQAAFPAFVSCAVNARHAEDVYPPVPGPPTPIMGPSFTSLVLVDENTVRAAFTPSPIGTQKHVYLRQALPGPGVRRWDPANGYIAEYSAHNANTPTDFALKFAHKTGYHGRYWLAIQNDFGGRSIETQFDISA